MVTNSFRLHARRTAKAALLLPLVAFVAGCSVYTEPHTDAERKSNAQSDLKMMFTDQEPVAGAMDFGEVVARAVRYNLDHRLKIVEQAFAAGEFRLARYDMLPRIVGQSGYSGRTNPSGSTSTSLLTGEQSLEASTSQDRDRITGRLSAVWNVLDFGVAYARAQQSSDQILIARERVRRVLDNIMLDVRNAYWRAVSAQSFLPEVDRLIVRVRSAIDRSRELEQKRLQPTMEALTFQRELLERLEELTDARKELGVAKAKLAALMNLRPGEKYTLKLPRYDVRRPPVFTARIKDLEKKALIDRPELREEHYIDRIHSTEVRKAYFKMFPRLEFEGAFATDSNSYLFNNEWAEYNVRLSYNLIRLFQGPAEIDVAKAQLSVSRARRYALTMAIMAQVRIAYHQYRLAAQKHRFITELEAVDSRILKLSKDLNTANMTDELELIRRSSNRALSLIKLYFSYSEVQNTFGRIYNAIGRDPLPLEQEATDLFGLAQVVSADDNLRRNELYGLASLPPELPVEADPEFHDETPNAALSVSYKQPALPRKGMFIFSPKAGTPPRQISGSVTPSHAVQRTQDTLADDPELWNLPVTIRLQ